MAVHEQGTNLYIAGVPKTTDDATFKQLFAPFGTIQSTKLCQGKFPEKFGFVRYSTAEEAQTAINSLNNFEFGGKRLQVKLANEKDRSGNSSGSSGNGPANPQYVVTNTGIATLVNAEATPPSSNLYIRGLPALITEETLLEVFGAYGVVKQTRVLDKSGVSGDSVAMVRMSTQEEATWIVNNLNGNIPQGLTNPVMVKFADPPELRAQRQNQTAGNPPPVASLAVDPFNGPIGSASPALSWSAPVDAQSANIYVAGLPETTDEATFRKLFEGFGNILSVKLCQGRFPEKYGFVKFSAPEEGQLAINTMNNFKFGARRLQVKVANEKRDGSGDDGDWGGGGVAGISLDSMRDTPTDSLFITGLPKDLTDQFLRDILGAYAVIVETRVLAQSDATGSMAVVRLGTVEEAVWMMTHLNGNIPQGLETPLSLRYYKQSSGPAKQDTPAGPGVASDPASIAEAMVRTAQQAAQQAGHQGQVAIRTPAPPPAPSRYAPYPPARRTAASPALMNAVSETVGRVKGFQAPVDGVDPGRLFIKGLPQDADDLYLYNVFSPFGALTSVEHQCDDQGNCTGMGYIRFGFPSDAQIAIQTLNGNRLPDGHILYVSASDAAVVADQLIDNHQIGNFLGNQEPPPNPLYALQDNLIPMDESHQVFAG
mmetsp:Transcript_109283/g.309143  ORF Transcript_109283/g.309143 Transcript_109283/m.309143 type:complete len:654 (-) Transcript_109283:114-2075(-)|eukprot:CAMPEP_0179244980 /NCGR_PEP_ID=MMETSP0797-20121207/18336_1 /TAXON_ID=47934 /ORGANISM="Dinophysis acuminata, Strain DAEP01" /LENGTH=653 /DNA_ID=CAMNT_0020952511 /DNA_START=74 /DNA_END=2035 /DNA_ORIENTATION=-